VTPYSRGTAYERRAAEQLSAEGYWCWLARGSKGAADLLALKPGQVVLVQVKGGRETIGSDGWNVLLALASELRAVPVVADWPEWQRSDAGPMRLRQITGPARRSSRSAGWPSVPFVTDEAG
jgi:Holliday junction resolvase